MSEHIIQTMTQILGRALGRRLRSVVYRTYNDDGIVAGIAAGIGWLHGEVVLTFDELPPLFISWGENEGGEDHFSLLPSVSSTYEPDTIMSFSAAGAPEWLPHMNQPLFSAQLLGSNSTPHILVLQFPTGGVVIGDGYEQEFGDGDRVLIHSLPDPQVSKFVELFWLLGAPATF